ncbi:MAG: ribonuclease HII [Promicromonosporaceae bacterium]|nr:ribonuclease HII [Promicromonosporaceae bacterium]
MFPTPCCTRYCALPAPDLSHEQGLLATGATLVAGIDEVGRGALAGPVSVGVVLVGAATPPPPRGVNDSKLLTAAARSRLAPLLAAWPVASAVGHAWPAEIDEHGIVAALTLAAERGLAAVTAVVGQGPDAAILDGTHNWLAGRVGGVETLVKADQRCASVAAASVLAKVERDALLAKLARSHPAYGWDTNRGYGSAAHRQALREHGPTRHHRLSWNLGIG